MELDLYLNDLPNRVENSKKMEAEEVPFEKKVARESRELTENSDF